VGILVSPIEEILALLLPSYPPHETKLILTQALIYLQYSAPLAPGPDDVIQPLCSVAGQRSVRADELEEAHDYGSAWSRRHVETRSPSSL
jgi:hypothetical protein